MNHLILTILLVFANVDLLCQSTNTDVRFADIKKNPNDKYEWKKEWNVVIAEAIDRYGSILMRDDSLPMEQITSLCPKFASATREQKIAFWTLVIAAIAKYESNFNPNTRFKEPPPLNVYSEGLLQLSYGDEKRYKSLPISIDKKNILDPAINLTSGVIILSRQMELKKGLFTTKHFYWSVLTNKQKEIKGFVAKYIGELGFCSK